MKKSELRKIIREELLRESTYIGGAWNNKHKKTIQQQLDLFKSVIEDSSFLSGEDEETDNLRNALTVNKAIQNEADKFYKAVEGLLKKTGVDKWYE